jgi:hypothetical protein
MEPETERRQYETAIIGLESRVDTLERVLTMQISNLAASINELRIVIEKLEAKGDTSCGKCKAEIAKEFEDIWREVKKEKEWYRGKIETLERKDGERAKNGITWAFRIVGGAILMGLLGLIVAWLKGA